MIYYIYNKNMN